MHDTMHYKLTFVLRGICLVHKIYKTENIFVDILL